jgi:hypothetical protein
VFFKYDGRRAAGQDSVRLVSVALEMDGRPVGTLGGAENIKSNFSRELIEHEQSWTPAPYKTTINVHWFHNFNLNTDSKDMC